MVTRCPGAAAAGHGGRRTGRLRRAARRGREGAQPEAVEAFVVIKGQEEQGTREEEGGSGTRTETARAPRTARGRPCGRCTTGDGRGRVQGAVAGP